jgi:hypothetical protein
MKKDKFMKNPIAASTIIFISLLLKFSEARYQGLNGCKIFADFTFYDMSEIQR